MKLNEIAAGKKIWVLVEMWDQGGIGDVNLGGAYPSEKAAEIAWMQKWLESVDDEISEQFFNDEDEGDSYKDPLPQLSKYAAAGNISKFTELANKQNVHPSWDDFSEFVTILETKLF